VVSRRQLLAIGIDDAGIRRRVRRGGFIGFIRASMRWGFRR
jgi:hypothetical protein